MINLLDSRQLLAFQALARHGSFTAAAKSLNLTQSAISHSIKALERSLEVTLFERLGKTVRLTRAGESLLVHSERILSRMHRAQEDLRLLERPGHGRLRIGATVTISQYILPSVLRELRETFPAFEISVKTDDSLGLMDSLEAGEIDVAVALRTPRSGSLVDRVLFQDEIQMAFSPVHPLANRAKLSKKDVQDENFIIYGETSETFRLLEKETAANGLRLNTALQVGSMAAIKEMAKIGMGVGLMVPWVAEQEISEGKLVFHPFPLGKLTRSWEIFRDPRHEKKMIEEVFCGICQNVVDTILMRTGQLISSQSNPVELKSKQG
ncbi:MAG: LysR family transcriptional regulator [Verrucomicrobiales bacterium]|nr:LysR family transcriptional regulator [Verrucomicrobiales bacterium]